MRPLRRSLALATLVALGSVSLLVASGAEPTPGREKGQTRLVSVGADGSLAYTPYTLQGDTLPDFSHCGFGGGGVPLPAAVVRETLSPEAGTADDTARIQAALDRIGNLPLGADGLRGAVLLRRGAYRCAGVLKLNASGVVLRGEGDGEDGTILTATARKQQPLVQIGGTAARDDPKTSRAISDAYVPVGVRSFSVADASGLAVGQNVFVVRHSNAAWISAIGMDRIQVRSSAPESTKQWSPFDLRFDRVITAIEGTRLTVDAPIVCAIDRRWGGGAVVRYNDAGRIERCGVESLRAMSVYDEKKTERVDGETAYVDESHATYLVAFGAVKNAWARKLTTLHFYHGPTSIGGAAKWITVEDCRSLAPVSQITGGRRYPFSIDGQLSLVQRCYSDHGRHAFVFGARVPGPNVFRECRSEHDHATSEPHHRWSVGGLYDNVEAQMAMQDRQWMGSGHGWAGANYVVWNSRGSLICQQPPTAQNFAIGFVGKRGKDAFPRPAGWWESEGTPVEPRSLYAAQLQARLGK
ncbi:MAG: hypothetical protein NTV51_20900 [Verrucomicrobia bacterium]|nr:hypothetical protein [Verrucomicrobiota bacterium]